MQRRKQRREPGKKGRAARDKVRADLFALFGEHDAHKRGKLLESVLNELFACHGILVREAFTITGSCGEGVIEQIDGLIELEAHLYLVEMKWWNASIGVGEIAPHLVRAFSRGGQARGLFISYTDFTPAAIAQCRDAIARDTVVVLSTLQDIVSLLSADGDLKHWLKDKLNAAVIDKQPFVWRGG